MRQIGAVLVCILLSACASPHALTSTGGPQFAAIGPQLGAGDAKDHVRTLTTQGRNIEAARFYEANRSSLPLTDSEVLNLVDSIARKLNWDQETPLRKAAKILREWSESDILAPEKWSAIRQSRLQADAASATYSDLPLVSDLRYRSKAFEKLQEERESLDRRLNSRGWDAFVAAHRQGIDYFSVFPGKASANEFFHRNAESLRKELSTASPAEVNSLFSEYGRYFPQTEAVLANLRSIRASNRNSHEKRAFWEPSIWQRPPASDLSLADLDLAQYLVHEGPAQLEIAGATDAGVEIAASRLRSIGKPYVAVVVQKSSSQSRRVVRKTAEQGRYLQAEYQVPNPAFAAAQARFISAQANLNNVRFRNTLNRQTSFAGALLAGLTEGVSGSEVTAARNELASTPATITQQTYASYQYEVVTVESSRTIPYEIVVIDLSAGRAKRLSKTLTLQQTFTIPYGRKPNDTTHPPYTFVSENSISEWDARPISLKLEPSTLLAELPSAEDADFATLRIAAGRPSALKFASLANAGSDRAAYVKEDPRFNSVVLLTTEKSLGAGFFVDDFLVVTNYHVVEGSSVVGVKMHDGTRAVGQVVKSDIGADLALLRVTQRGYPVELSTAPIGPGETVDAIGHPEGLEFTLTRGVVSAIRTISGSYASGTLTVIQTDTPINPGNSGGPLFHGNAVVGINTRKFAKSESLGFAVHVRELSRLLASH